MSLPEGLFRRRGGRLNDIADTQGESSFQNIRVDAELGVSVNFRQQRQPVWASGSNGPTTSLLSTDVLNEAELRQPKLTLMEEVLLLGLKDKQGYLSFWNENMSYALRGCILLELAFRGRISMQKNPARKRHNLEHRFVEVIDETLTGEVLLDETLKMMKTSEKMTVVSWMDLLSGETWNLMKIGFQLKQVRERLAKGLVDKGILRTEKRNFVFFDMATHPVVNFDAKQDLNDRVQRVCTARTPKNSDSIFLPADVEFRYLRTVTLVCAAYAANVLENAFVTLSHDSRERAFAEADELLANYSEWPFRQRGSVGHEAGLTLASMVAMEVAEAQEKGLQLEVVAAVLSVFTHLDSLL